MPLIQNVLLFLAVVGTIQASPDIKPRKACPPPELRPISWNDSIKPMKTSPPAGCQRRVCYFTNWSQHGAGVGFLPKDYDANLCTHIIISRAIINFWYLTLDRLNNNVLELKKTNPDLKVLVSVGGFDASSEIIKDLIKSGPDHQSWFAISTISYMISRGFDGLDWHYPVSSKTLPEDKINFTQLMKIMRGFLIENAKDCGLPEPLLMTATLPGDKATVHSGFDIPSLGRDLDFVNLMTFDSPEDSDVKWRHINPLFGEAENTREHNVDFYTKNWIEKGFPKDKIVVGIPAYGSSLSLTSAHDYVTYNEVCEMIQDGALVKRLPKENVPILIHGFTLVSYEDPYSVMTKVKYVKDQGYGGVMVRSLNDFNTTACHTGKYPLLNAIKQECSKVLPK